MKQFGLLQAIWMAFYSRDLYRDVAHHWKGIGVRYLMLLLAVSWLPSAVRWVTGLRTFAARDVPPIVSQVPEVVIANGVMQANPHAWDRSWSAWCKPACMRRWRRCSRAARVQPST